MKNLFTWCFLFVCFQTISQTPKLTLSTEFPEPGQEITFTYEGRLVNANARVECVYFHTPKAYQPNFGVPITIKENKIVGKLILPDTVTYVSIIISDNDKDVETNNGQGFGFNLFKDQKLIPGTLLAEGYSMQWRKHYYDIPNDIKKGIQLMEKEFELNPEMKEKGQTYYIELLSNYPETKNKGYTLAKEMYDRILATGEGESQGYFYSNILANRDFKARDSLMKPILVRYPLGYTALVKYMNKLSYLAMYQPDSAIQVFNYIQSNYPNIKPNNRRVVYEGLLNAYASLGDTTSFLRNLTFINDTDKSNQTLIISATTSYEMAKTLKSQKKIPEALRFLDLSEKYFKDYNPYSRYYGYALETKAAIQIELGKVDEAIELKKKALRLTSTIFPDQNVVLLEYLAHAKRYEEVARYGQQFITTNSSNKQIDSLYAAALLVLPKEKQQQYATAFTEADRNFYKALDDKMLMEAISDFRLVDLTGKPVSLSDFKGKIVVLDFWAVWCKPCIESFGGMNELVQSYPKDEVQFLFIDITQENSEAVRIQKIKKILALQKVPNFDVLLDKKEAIGFQVHSNLNVEAIPEKLVIDREGRLRYRSTGFSTKNELVKEMTYVISQVKNN